MTRLDLFARGLDWESLIGTQVRDVIDDGPDPLVGTVVGTVTVAHGQYKRVSVQWAPGAEPVTELASRLVVVTEREQVEAALAAAVAVINRAAARGFRSQRDFVLEQARRDVPMLQQRLRELDRAERK